MSLTEEQNQYIKNLYVLSDNNYEKAAKLFKDRFGFIISRDTFTKKWKKAEFELNSHGGSKNRFDDNQFKEIYTLSNGDIGEIIALTGYSLSTIKVKCRKFGLEVKVNKEPTPKIEDKYDKVYSAPQPGKIYD